jgi:hypothetical protein
MASGKNMRLIGRREYVNFPQLNLNHIEAKIDTGAYTCAIHCNHISLKDKNGKPTLCFQLLDDTTYHFEHFTRKKIKNSFGEMEERYIIKTLINIGKKKINTTISLSDRGNMRYPVLIGRKLLKGKFVVDVNQIYTNGLRLTNLLK